MNSPQPCILYTQDKAWEQRIAGFLRFMSDVRPATTPKKLEQLIAQSSPALLLLDLRASGTRDMLPRLRKAWSENAVIAMGVPRSDPMREAQAAGVYAVEDLSTDRQRLQALVAHALDHMELLQENRMLREARPHPTSTSSVSPVWTEPPRTRDTRPSQIFSSALRHLDDIDILLQRAVEGVAVAATVLRAGVFAQTRVGEVYRMRAALRCSEELRSLEFAEDDPLVQWLETQTQLISRATLEHVQNVSESRLLKRSLEDVGADVIVPLIGAGRLLGWLFVGPRSTGLPFVMADLEDLVLLAEPIATALENAIIYEETTVQKTLMETLLNTLPTGIIVTEAEGEIRWMNSAAENIMELSPDDVLGEPVERLGTRMADAVHRALLGEEINEPTEWTEPDSKRVLRVQTCRLADPTHCLGAVALVQDVTIEQVLQDKEQEIDRTAFWAELAASMSHEIRNPLVAIKTFAQLLPERYADPEFRTEFSNIVTTEIDRLNGIVDQINSFAHPPKLELKPLDIGRTVQKGLNLAMVRHPEYGITFEISIDEHLPRVGGDENALSECFAHIFTNAIEAVMKSDSPRILLTARRSTDPADEDRVRVTVQDNGSGIPTALQPKIFSPFCTSKARGMGLGLPIVKRTVVDHKGHVHIDTGDKGTSVSVDLPKLEDVRTKR